MADLLGLLVFAGVKFIDPISLAMAALFGAFCPENPALRLAVTSLGGISITGALAAIAGYADSEYGRPFVFPWLATFLVAMCQVWVASSFLAWARRRRSGAS